MVSGHEGTGDNQVLIYDVVDWYVQNESDREPDRATLLRWQLWSNNGQHCKEYEDLVQMMQQLRLLGPPSQPARGELIADLEKD